VGIRDHLKHRGFPFQQAAPQPGKPLAKPNPEVKSYEVIKREFHEKILKEIDVRRFDPVKEPAAFKEAVRELITNSLETTPVPLNRDEKERLTSDLVEESMGMGLLTPMFEDPAISDILINGPDQVYIEKFGRLEKTSIRFQNEEHLLRLIERIVARVGRHIDQSSPMVDARLPDGSRVNAIIPPLSLVGPVLSIRRFGLGRYSVEDLIKFGTLTPVIAEILEGLVRTRANIMISGGTGSGKTTLLNVLSSYISPSERIVTIEDAAELRLQQDHVVRLEARPPNVEGRGHVTIRDLMINALRMRPDRIVVGEVRGAEAFDMLHAMTTGHDGGMTSIHSNSPRDALKRLETMVLMAGTEFPARAIRDLIGSGIEIILHLQRMEDGSRRLTHVTEIVGMEGDNILLQNVFEFRVSEIREGKVMGKYVATGVRPSFIRKLEVHGFTFEPGLFMKDRSI
jgi:pilus assembly protein CpaF